MATWNAAFNASPANSDSPSEGDDKIRETRLEIYNRELKEHQWGSNSTTDGYHLEGAARGYYAATAPTTRPDGVTSLGTNDDGRIWFDSDDNNKGYVYGSSTWNSITVSPAITSKYVDYSSVVSSISVVTAILEIGSWNMDTTASVTVTIPPGWGTYTPYYVGVCIIGDSTEYVYGLIAGHKQTTIQGHWRIDFVTASYSIALVRTAGGCFDSFAFDGTQNRGYVYLIAKDNS